MISKSEFSVSTVIVHYKTFDLTRRALWSLNSFYPNLNTLVIENNSRDGSAEKLQKLKYEIPNFDLLLSDKNLHHGPGLDKGINSCSTEWILSFDSDCIAYRGGFIEAMLNKASQNTYVIGEMISLDEDGFKSENSEGVNNYIHPYCALFKKEFYLQLPPFNKHGSPCLENEIRAVNLNYELKHFPIYDYVYHEWRGTAGKFGYNLGWKSKIQFIKWKLKNIKHKIT